MQGIGDALAALRGMGVNVEAMDQEAKMVVLFMAQGLSSLESTLMAEMRTLQQASAASNRLITENLTETRRTQRTQGERLGDVSERVSHLEHELRMDRVEFEHSRSDIAALADALKELSTQLRPLAEQQIRWKAQFAVVALLAGGVGGSILSLFGQG